jgi:hypothetical protein
MLSLRGWSDSGNRVDYSDRKMTITSSSLLLLYDPISIGEN